MTFRNSTEYLATSAFTDSKSSDIIAELVTKGAENFTNPRNENMYISKREYKTSQLVTSAENFTNPKKGKYVTVFLLYIH